MAMVGGLTTEQREHISFMIRDALGGEGKDAMEKAAAQVQEKLQSVMVELDQHHAKKNVEVDEKTKVIGEQQQQIVDLLRAAEESYKTIQNQLATKEAQIVNVVEQLTAQEEQKKKIIEELNNRQREMEQFKAGIESMGVETQRLVNQASGGWKETIQRDINEMQRVWDAKVLEMSAHASATTGRMNTIEAVVTTAMGTRTGAGASSGGGSGFAGFKKDYEGLIAEKELTMPKFPSEKPSLEEFRKWLRAFARHCSRRPGFPCTELIVKSIRGTDVPLDGQTELTDMIVRAQGMTCDEYQKGPVNIDGAITLQSFWTQTREHEFFEGIEYSLGDKCVDILSEITRGHGYELMRQLIRTFDPKNANIRQYFVAELHGLTNKKCADFAAVVARVGHIERIVKEMRPRRSRGR